ncbi:MAG: hypothetical protein ACF8CQ_04690 [Rhodopirellula sp. JB044]|uniref:hypothetical protein n=1 Tax=Rhodopirellula sp. JB044 TaxID=3342844 RepID=UPI00370B58A2
MLRLFWNFDVRDPVRACIGCRVAVTTVVWIVVAETVAFAQSPGDAVLRLNAPRNRQVSVQPTEIRAPIARPSTMAGSPNVMSGAVPTGGVSMTSEQTRQSVQWLADQLMMHVPRRIEGDDDWGNTKRVWAGVKMRRDGWELKTHRRWKELRHGRWVRYEIRLPRATVPVSDVGTALGSVAQTSRSADTIQIHGVTPTTNQEGFHRWRVDASAFTPADFTVRVERWNLGAKWYSIEIVGDMQLQLRTELTMAMEADFAEVPPAMQLDVEIEKASLKVMRFEVDRISKLGGDAAEEIGDLAEKTIGKVWVRKENGRLVNRLNDAISDNRDSLRWSMAGWLGQLGQ